MQNYLSLPKFAEARSRAFEKEAEEYDHEQTDEGKLRACIPKAQVTRFMNHGYTYKGPAPEGPHKREMVYVERAADE